MTCCVPEFAVLDRTFLAFAELDSCMELILNLPLHSQSTTNKKQMEEGKGSSACERSDWCFTGGFYSCLLRTEDSEDCRGLGLSF